MKLRIAAIVTGLILAGVSLGAEARPAQACTSYERAGCVVPANPPPVVNSPGPRPPEVPMVIPNPPSNEGPCRGGRAC